MPQTLLGIFVYVNIWISICNFQLHENELLSIPYLCVDQGSRLEFFTSTIDCGYQHFKLSIQIQKPVSKYKNMVWWSGMVSSHDIECSKLRNTYIHKSQYRVLEYWRANVSVWFWNEKGKQGRFIHNFMQNWLVFWEFPSTVHISMCQRINAYD
jgi:hypothetical protein